MASYNNKTNKYPIRYPPRNISNAPYYEPDKEADIGSISRLFLTINTGDFELIRKTIISEKISLSVYDEDNKTALHYILLNSKLDDTQKYTLIKRVIDMGTMIDHPDNNNVRPLHLASSQQNYKIVKLLLDHKAEPNSQDNNHMTPLHYSVMPQIEECKIYSTDKTIDQIDQTESKSDQIKKNIMSKFQTAINNDLFTNNISKLYIEHLIKVYSNDTELKMKDGNIKELIKQYYSDNTYQDNNLKNYTENIESFKTNSNEYKIIEIMKPVFDNIKLYISALSNIFIL
jgi:ankyrin repeat protein